MEDNAWVERATVVLDALESDVLVLKPDEVIAHLEELVAQR